MKTIFVWKVPNQFVHIISMFRSFWDIERPSEEWVSECSFLVDLNLYYEANCTQIWTQVGKRVHGEVLCKYLTLPGILVSSKVQPEPNIKSPHLRPPRSSSPCQIHFQQGQWPCPFLDPGVWISGICCSSKEIDLRPLVIGTLRRSAGLNEAVIQSLICSYARLCSIKERKSLEQCTS